MKTIAGLKTRHQKETPGKTGRSREFNQDPAASPRTDIPNPGIQPRLQPRRPVSVVMPAAHRAVDQGCRPPIGLTGALRVVLADLLENTLDGGPHRRPLGDVVKAPDLVLPGSLACLW
jgi:hypothetical protein